MTFSRLLLRNLRYHWRGNLAVFLGVALGTAVLTGALLVGDSLRGSMRALLLDQLGWVRHAMTPGRFFRQALVEQLPAGKHCALLLLGGSATLGEAPPVGKVSVLGINGQFWPDGNDQEFWQSNQGEVVLNQTSARLLGAKVGDRINLNVQRADAVPRETLLGKRKTDETVSTLLVKVRAILADEGMARFTLRPTPEPIRNAFVPLKFLQEKLELPGKVNAVLTGPESDGTVDLAAHLTLEDWGLKLRTPEDRARAMMHFLDPRNQASSLKKKSWEGRVPADLARLASPDGVLTRAQIVDFFQKYRNYTVLESAQLFLDERIEKALPNAGVKTLVSLADGIAAGSAELPYAVVAALAPKDIPSAMGNLLKNDEIALVHWPESPLKAKVGDPVTVTYFSPDERNHLQQQKETFRVGLILPLDGPADDADWTPEFPGITDKLKISEWENPPFPYNPKRIKPVDENYWKRYRATPKAYVSLATGQRLWSSRFGKMTSVRFTGDPALFGAELLSNLKPEQGGFVFHNVRAQGERSSGGATDFGVLFLAFSFFLIVAALLLVGLLFRLNLDRRATEIGLLLATGWDQGKVRRLLLSEGCVLAVLGALVGLVGAGAYAFGMLQLLTANWPGGGTLSFLKLHATPFTFGVGFAASVLISALTLLWAIRVLSKVSPRSLLAGESTASVNHAVVHQGSGMGSKVTVMVSAVGAVGCFLMAFVLQGHEAKAGSFFGAGALFLTAALAFIWRALKQAGGPSDPQPTLARLGIRNAGRHAVRSVLTVGLLASATFLVTAVESFHKEAGADFQKKDGGSGGFALVAESDVPLFQDLNQPKVRLEWDLPPEGLKTLEPVKVFSLRVRAGDDASCLNLYQPLKPRIVGVPSDLVEEGRFHFGGHLKLADVDAKNPWKLLEMTVADGAIPAIVDANTAQWILKVGLGETLDVQNDQGDTVKLRVVGLLQESIFQSEVLVSAKHFLALFSRSEGFSLFLADCGDRDPGQVKTLLEKALVDQGFQATLSVDRLQSYLAVENMYLATFQALGGLGLLLGALGLAIVLLRGVWERRGELALLRALGFGRTKLAWLVLAENAYLLALGLGAGVLSALLAVAPHLAGSGAKVLWFRIIALLGTVVVVGLGAGLAAVFSSLRTPVLTALRRE